MGSIRVPLKGSIRGLGGSGLVSRVISTLKSILIGVVVLVTPSIGFRLSQLSPDVLPNFHIASNRCFWSLH